MILYVGMIFALLLAGGRPRIRGLHEGYLSKESTDAVRGVFILLIFASHFAQYIDPLTLPMDLAYGRIRTALGQAVVTCFLFYSGYGVALSADKKGQDYVRDIPRRRILSTLLTYDCAVLLYMVLQLCRGNHYPVTRFLAALASWQGVGNSDWYIFSILCCYAVTWLVLRWRPGGGVDKGAALAVTTGCAAVMLFLICAGKDSYWYNTILCYPLGMWYYLYKDRVDRAMRRDVCYYPVLLVTLLAYALAHKFWRCHLSVYMLTMLLFALSVVFLTMKFEPRNRFLIYCGRHLTGLYLLQRIPMIVLQKYFDIGSESPERYLYFALCVALTFPLEAAFSRWVRAMGIGKKPV